MTHEKVFRCTSCQAIYLDVPVSQCDCMGGPTCGAEFTEWRLVSVADSELLVTSSAEIKRLRDVLRDIAESKSLTATPSQFVRHIQRAAKAALDHPTMQAQQLGDMERLIELAAALNLAIKNSGHVEIPAEHWHPLPQHLQDAIHEAEKRILASASVEVAQGDSGYCSAEKVSQECPVCNGSGQYDGGKCDGFPF